jgi:predicted RNase H-like HicB family nuclease
MATRAERLGRYTELDYPIEITRDEFGYFARIPDLPGCESNGATPDDAVRAIAEAKETWLEAALDAGISIPEPRGEDGYSGKFVVRVPTSVHRDLVRIASSEGVSLNALVSSVLARETGRLEAPRAAACSPRLVQG